MSVGRAAAVVVAIVTAACFSPDIGDGQVPCGTAGECPSGFHCVGGLCFKMGVAPGADAAAAPDAAPADAPLPADAAPRDAPAPDAPPPDAPAPDAAAQNGTISVAFAGDATGSVLVGDAITCTTPCAPSFPVGTHLTLRAVPEATAIFGGWSGACSGMGVCPVVVDAAGVSVTASFVPATSFVELNVTVDGPGTVAVSPPGTSCGLGCYRLGKGSTVTVTAEPETGFSTIGWTGAGCEDSGVDPCTFTLNAETRVVARFCPWNRVADAVNGDDGNAGTCREPVNTITRALLGVAPGALVHAGPGSYDAELFPIAVPDGVTLTGDEPARGVGPPATSIVGDGAVPGSNMLRAAVTVGKGAAVAGFIIRNEGTLAWSEAVVLTRAGGADGATVRNCTVHSDVADGIYVDDAPAAVIIGNDVQGSDRGVGVWITSGGAGTLLQANRVGGNSFGVQADADADLGGGAAGSLGGNTLSCNVETDLVAQAAAGSITVDARDNLWDHVPPSAGCASTRDVCALNAAVATDGALLAGAPCD